MYKGERKRDILALLQSQGFTSTQVLAKQLSVSQATIYRYLSELERDGLIRKEYGGGAPDTHALGATRPDPQRVRRGHAAKAGAGRHRLRLPVAPAGASGGEAGDCRPGGGAG